MKKNIFVGARVTMPDGSRPSLREFLDWAKSFDHDQPPQHGSLAPSVCTPASILADCFPCIGGPISSGAPGPVCGWTFRSPFGGKGGSVTFVNDMLLRMGGFNESPGASKPAIVTNVGNLTWQYTFTEFPAPVGGGTSVYDNFIVNSGRNQAVQIRFTDNGTFIIAIGPLAGATFYTGNWIPNNGTHTVHLIVDGALNPLLWIDGIPVPATPVGGGSINIGTLPHDVVFFSASSGGFFPDAATIRSVFITSGALPPSTVFCC